MNSGYEVIYLAPAEKFFKKHPKKLSSSVFHKINEVSINPFASNINLTKLKDPLSGYRLRVGDFRVIYILDTKTQRLVVTKIDHRSSVYKY